VLPYIRIGRCLVIGIVTRRHPKSALVPLRVPLAMRDGLSAHRCTWPDTLSYGAPPRPEPARPAPPRRGTRRPPGRYLADWSRRTQWPAPGTTTVRTRSLCTASCRGAIGESGGTSGLQAAHASISALLQELSRSIRATCPAWRAIASRKSSFSATNPGPACDSRLAGPGPRARAHRPCPAGQPQHAAPGGHPASARRARPARAGRPRQ